ncbi:MAG: hypothetical protein QNJ34_10210 [Xenococcaceae cyanobacterium MO_188.B29]|nr:hypothetical protein [Xenococcaceae cyanobacterium MO_188.B29]
MKKQLLTTTMIVASLFPTYSVAQETEMDLFNLCSKFPLNSKCKGYEAPISLKSRPGEQAQCIVSGQEKAEKCKVNITDESLKFYMETGKELSILDDSKDTKELVIPLTVVDSFSYSEKKKTDIGAVLALGVWGLFAKKKTSTFNFRLEPQEEAEEKIIPQQVVFVVQRKLGREMRENLEEKIGVPAEILDID